MSGFCCCPLVGNIMPEPMIALLIGASLASLIGYRYWTDRQRAGRRPSKVNEAEVYCVWLCWPNILVRSDSGQTRRRIASHGTDMERRIRESFLKS